MVEEQTAEEVFYTAKIDSVFKTVVIDEKNPSILEGILSNVLGGHPKVLSLPRTVISKDVVNEKAKDRDLVIELDGKYINLEVVTGHGRDVRAQLFTYHASMWKQNIIKSEKYDTKTLFLQIVLQYNLGENKPLIRTFKMQSVDENTGKPEVWIDNFVTIQINMAGMKKLWYDNDREAIEKYPYLMMLDMNKDELECLLKLRSDDKIVEEYKNKVCDLNDSPNFINTIGKERERELVHNTALELAKEEGIEQGIEQGIEEGEYKKQIEMAKTMLELNKLSIEDISKITELSIEELEELRND